MMFSRLVIFKLQSYSDPEVSLVLPDLYTTHPKAFEHHTES